MNIKTWLSEERGRGAALAAHLNVSPGRVSQMVSDGVPAKYMLGVRDFTEGAVTLEEMVAAKTPQASEEFERKHTTATADQAQPAIDSVAAKEAA